MGSVRGLLVEMWQVAGLVKRKKMGEMGNGGGTNGWRLE